MIENQIREILVRLDIREIDAEIAKLTEESECYSRLVFGGDLADIQMKSLQDEKLQKVAELEALQRPDDELLT